MSMTFVAKLNLAFAP